MYSQINVIKECKQVKIIIVKLKLMSGILLDPEVYKDIISFLKLIGNHFMDEVKRNGDHFEVGIILRYNWGSFRSRDHFGGFTVLFTTTQTVCFNLEL